MPYRARFYVPGLSVHVMRRGNNHQTIFRDDRDRFVFLNILRKGAREHGLLIHAFVLMTNHYHALATPANPTALPQTMKVLGERYVKYFNCKYDRIGTLWTGRYRALPIESSMYWLNCLRYIAQNPVRAKIVESPDAYRWSSYRRHACGESWDWLDEHRVLRALGSTVAERQAAYRARCSMAMNDQELAQQRYIGPEIESRIVSACDWYESEAEEEPA